jgi:hypothetical protein
MTQPLSVAIGLIGRPRFHRDPLFWLAVGAGGLVALGLRAWAPLEGGVPDSAVLLWTALWTVFLYPVAEELAFRGALQGWLLRLRWGRRSRAGVTLANLATSAVFTGLHFVYHPALWAASVGAPSLVFGFFRDRAGSVYPSIALHVTYNLFYLMAAASASA